MKTLLACTAILTLVFTAAGASATVTSYNNETAFLNATAGLTIPLQLIDFDHYADGTDLHFPVPPVPGNWATLLNGMFATLGVTFGADNYVYLQNWSLPSTWLNNAWGVIFAPPPISATFTVPGVAAVGLNNVINSGRHSGSGSPVAAELMAYGPGGVYLGSVTSDDDTTTADFFGIISTTPIALIQINLDQDHQYGFDNLRFGSNPVPDPPDPHPLVPLPPALFLLGSAFPALAVIRRRVRLRAK